MNAVPEVIVHRDEAALAASVAARLITRIVDAQVSRGQASIVLTGGGIGIASLAAVRNCPAVDAVDWSAVDFWWGDERFEPDGAPDRNATQAREALLDHLPVDPARVHAMPSSRNGLEPEDAAEDYAAELAAAARPEDHGKVPRFDVLMLGVGPEGHIASLFPEMPAVHDNRPVCAVRGSPKPPPIRITLTFPAIQSATEVWLLAAGEAKAAIMPLALSEDTGIYQVPAAGARGKRKTLALLDLAAASRLPSSLWRPASP